MIGDGLAGRGFACKDHRVLLIFSVSAFSRLFVRRFGGKGKRRKREPSRQLLRKPLAVAFHAADDYSRAVPVHQMTCPAAFQG
jgi:hypothetical protein